MSLAVMRSRIGACLFAVGLTLALLIAASAHAQSAAQVLLRQGATYRQQGNLNLALDALLRAREMAQEPPLEARIAAELGVAYYQAHRFDDAGALLEEAYAGATDVATRRRYAIDLGNLFAARRKPEQAARYYDEARVAGAEDPATSVSAGLNLARFAPAGQRLPKLTALAAEVATLADARERARMYLNLGLQARELGEPALRLAYDSLVQARRLTAQVPGRLNIEVQDALAQLYEDKERRPEALALTDAAIASLPSGSATDLRFNLEWRRGRLLRQLGQTTPALGAYQRAVDHLEAIRQDIPVEYVDGRSSFRETLEPVYLGLADLLLRAAEQAPDKERAGFIRRARDVVELIKQTELEDFLGDRCTTEVARNADRSIPAGTAVLYPIIFPDRLELLVETANELLHRVVPVTADQVRRSSLAIASALRRLSPFMVESQRLHRWLLAPVEPLLQEQRIDTVVVVPDGVLRLLPFAALHDGSRFMAEKYAFAVVPGLSLTRVATPGKRDRPTLLAGLSEPGPVVDKLPGDIADAILGSVATPASGSDPTSGGTRAVYAFRAAAASRSTPAAAAPVPAIQRSLQESNRLRERLALPAVKLEIEAIEKLTGSRALLNQDFNLAAFQSAVDQQSYGIVHIASHGFFGGSAETTFVMAHDDLLTIDRLQALLRTGAAQENPIDLLTLSACETAEGDDRSPLGMSGAALRARASSVLGSLWPVADEAAMQIMGSFYESLASNANMTKIQALQKAQRLLIAHPKTNHPFYWAPFILIGNWL